MNPKVVIISVVSTVLICANVLASVINLIIPVPAAYPLGHPVVLGALFGLANTIAILFLLCKFNLSKRVEEAHKDCGCSKVKREDENRESELIEIESECIRTQKALQHVLKFAKAVALCAQTLMEENDPFDALDKIASELLDGIGMSRMLIFKSCETLNDGICIRLVCGVSLPEFKAETYIPKIQYLPFSDLPQNFFENLRSGKICASPGRCKTCRFNKHLDPDVVISPVVVPIFISGRFWGFICFSDFANKYSREEVDIRVLETISSIIGSAIKRKLAEKALRDQWEVLHNVISNIPFNVFWKDRDQVYMGCNKLYAETSGVGTPENIVGKTDYDLPWKIDETEFFRKCDREVMESGEAQLNYEESLFSKDRTECTVLTSKVPLKDPGGEICGVLGMYTDITEKKKLEREMALLAAIIEQANEIVIISDLDRKIKYVNPAFEKVTGFAAAEVIDKTTNDYIENADPKSLAGEIDGALASGESWTGCVIRKKKDGTHYQEEVNIWPVVDRSGNPMGHASVGRDITKQIRMEGELRQAQKLESIGQLAAGIAHEINTPTQYVGDNTRFLQDSFNDLLKLIKKQECLVSAAKSGSLNSELVEEVESVASETDLEYLSEEIPKAIEQSLEGIGRVTRIVRAMKEFSHPGKEEKTPIDINKAIESTVTVARNEWKYVADVKLEFQEDMPPVPCYAGDFNQVILNLLTNAAHAIGDKVGDGSKGKGLITIKTRLDGDMAEICVADSGTGIPENIRGRVFDPFFTSKAVGRGTGQGLSIAHAVIREKHGGTINFETEEGVGTVFFIRIPMGSDSDGEDGADE